MNRLSKNRIKEIKEHFEKMVETNKIFGFEVEAFTCEEMVDLCDIIFDRDAQISGMKKALEKIIALGHYTGREIAEQALKEFANDII